MDPSHLGSDRRRSLTCPWRHNRNWRSRRSDLHVHMQHPNPHLHVVARSPRAKTSVAFAKWLTAVKARALLRSAAGDCASADPRYGPSRFARCTLGLGKCRQEPSRQEAPLQYDIYNSSSLGDFLSPLNRLTAIIERLLPTAIEADLVLGHRAPTLLHLETALAGLARSNNSYQRSFTTSASKSEPARLTSPLPRKSPTSEPVHVPRRPLTLS